MGWDFLDEDAVNVDVGDGIAGGGDPEELVGIKRVEDEGVGVVFTIAGLIEGDGLRALGGVGFGSVDADVEGGTGFLFWVDADDDGAAPRAFAEVGGAGGDVELDGPLGVVGGHDGGLAVGGFGVGFEAGKRALLVEGELVLLYVV